MALGAAFLARKKKQESKGIKSSISLGHIKNGILPILEMVKLVKPTDELIEIEFHWQQIKDEMCPITIYVRKPK